MYSNRIELRFANHTFRIACVPAFLAFASAVGWISGVCFDGDPPSVPVCISQEGGSVWPGWLGGVVVRRSHMRGTEASRCGTPCRPRRCADRDELLGQHGRGRAHLRGLGRALGGRPQAGVCKAHVPPCCGTMRPMAAGWEHTPETYRAPRRREKSKALRCAGRGWGISACFLEGGLERMEERLHSSVF